MCVQGETDFSSDQKGHKKVRERLRGNKAELSWLMRTSYINNEADIRRKPRAPRVKPTETAAPEVDLDEAHFQAVQARLLPGSLKEHPCEADWSLNDPTKCETDLVIPWAFQHLSKIALGIPRTCAS